VGVAEAVHVRPVEGDPRTDLPGPGDRSVSGNEDIDVHCYALQQGQRGEVVLDRVGGVVHVE
jgi:hypothetical protein